MLHIHNGDSAARTAEKAGIPGEHLAWREALVCGPAPGGLLADEFRRARAKYLVGAYGANLEECEQELRAQEDALSRCSNHEEVVLWFEYDLFCQVQLIYLLDWFARRELDRTSVSLICIGEFSDVQDFRGLGQLDEAQLCSLFPKRQELTAVQLMVGSRAWQAYSSPNPKDIESFLDSDLSALPFLRNALAKHLQRFPSMRNGLGRIENLALELVASGQHKFKSLFPEFGKREPEYGFGDAQLFLEMKRLANAVHPLLIMGNGASAMDAVQIKTSFQITELGEAVLQGEEDFVRTNGIDLWLGGVHLAGDECEWRWDELLKRLVATMGYVSTN